MPLAASVAQVVVDVVVRFLFTYFTSKMGPHVMNYDEKDQFGHKHFLELNLF